MTAISAAPAIHDLANVRLQFPALLRRHEGHPVAYFDGPGGTQVPESVARAMTDYLYHHNANTHWAFPTSAETDAAILSARAALADFLGATAEEIAFGANMTTLTFHLARALARKWGPGDEVVITELDHHANVAPWEAIAKERGVTLKVVPFNRETFELDLGALEAVLTHRVRLLAIGAASNALGTITDVTRASAMARRAGALTFVDAVHYAAHGRVNVGAIGCDFLACSAYKFYGAHIGVLYGRRDRIEALDVPKLRPAPDTAPERLETGTQNHEGMVGAAAAVEFIASMGQGSTRSARLQSASERLHHHGQSLVERLWNGLGEIAGVTRFGPPPNRPRTPTVVFTVREDLYSLTIGTQTYSIGPGGSGVFAGSTRPVTIQSANWILASNGISNTIKLLSDEEWSEIDEKVIHAILVKQLYCDYAFPTSTLKVRPIPTEDGTLDLFTWQQFSNFPDLVTDVTFPPGYDLAIIYNLAVVIAPGLVGVVPPPVAALAQSYKAAIMKHNLPPRPGVADENMATQAVAQPPAAQ